MTRKNWIFPKPLDFRRVEELAEQLNILTLTASILMRRGMDTVTEIQSFFEPKGRRFSDYKLLPGTIKAGEIIANAIQQKKLMVLFGDYDVDGVTAAALMVEFIRSRGGQVMAHLPDRYSEGYGLNTAFIENAAELNAQLLITVDCGVTAINEIALAKQKRLTVIVTDHHEPGQKLPEADVLVNPKVAGPENLRILAGVGVSLQVIRATAAALGEKDTEHLRKHLDLVALGTIADVVPLIGENRLLAKAGLAVINRGNRLGLKALMNLAGIGIEPLTSTDLAYRIAPRLNAAGRMSDAKYSLDLLLANDALTADELAQKLNQENSKRQAIQKRVLSEAERQIDEDALPMAITVYGEDWPHGVVGLVAAGICEKYYRPCFALSINGIEVKGSGRSIKGFSLHQVLNEMGPLLEKWGGHEMAAGVTFKKENLSIFQETLSAIADKMLDQAALCQELALDAETNLEQVNYKLIREMKRFEPFGFCNHKPLFVIRELRLSGPARIVGEKHLKMKLSDDNNRIIDVIGFGLGSRLTELALERKIDIVGYLSENNWNGTNTVQFELKDFRPGE